VRKVFIVVAALGLVGLFVWLLAVLMDASISLDHSRQQIHFLTERCRLLARVADFGVRGRKVEDLTRNMGSEVTVKREGRELRLDDTVVLTVNGNEVTSVSLQTCD
jgi:hypothetical protein